MATLFVRKNILCTNLRKFHKTTVRFSTPTFDPSEERKALHNALPEVLDSLVTRSNFKQLPEVGSWIRKVLEYTLIGGKMSRGLSVPIAYRMLEEPQHFAEERLHSARILGWCLEMMQAYFLVIDDIMDGSTKRRDKPCWYRQPDVGLAAINDGVLICQSLKEALNVYFRNTPEYNDMIRLFDEYILFTSMGEYLDCASTYNKEKNNLDTITMDRFDTIATYKTSFYSFKLPLYLALLLVKNGYKKQSEDLSNICLELGKLLQIQDDYLDVFGDETVTGKVGTDIQEGKCTWMIVTALQRCNESQRDIIKEYYGSKNPEHVKRVKQLFEELNIPVLYKKQEDNLYIDLLRRIHALPTGGDIEYFLYVLNSNYKRNV